jgi:hypothetical protein
VRRGVALGVKETRAAVVVPTPKAAPGTAFPPRRLMLRGHEIFELNLWCGTCPALFKKLSQPETADLALASERLSGTLERIDEDVLQVYGRVLPRSNYTVLLLEVTPQLVEPGSGSDYFTHEQVVTWGVDPVVGVPEDPGTPYYRTFEAPTGNDGHMYEFIVPMVPPAWNDSFQVGEYSRAAEPGTAVSYSLLDVIQPAMDEGEDYYEHWVLTHFLLDGHHKVEAAAAAGRPLRVLALVDERISIASPEELASMVQARAAERLTRHVRPRSDNTHPMSSEREQIEAILSWDIFRWAVGQLPPTVSIDDVRFRDLISVSEQDVFDYVVEHGFSESLVAERDAARFADDRLCMVPMDDGRWSVYYTERGVISDQVTVPSEAAARREIVHRLWTGAKVSLNHRYRLAHPDEDLPPPSEMV